MIMYVYVHVCKHCIKAMDISMYVYVCVWDQDW